MLKYACISFGREIILLSVQKKIYGKKNIQEHLFNCLKVFSNWGLSARLLLLYTCSYYSSALSPWNILVYMVAMETYL